MQNLFQRFNNLSFGLKVGLALVLIGVVPVVIVSYALMTNSTGALQRQTLDNMESIGKSRQAVLASFIQARIDEAEVLAGRETLRGNTQNSAGLPVFWQYKHSHDEPDYQAAYQETLKGLQSILATHSSDYLDIMAYDRIGDRVAQATDPELTNMAEDQVAEQPFFIEGMNGNPYFGDIIENPLVPGEQVYFVSYPVYHYLSPDVIGVVVIKGNPKAIDALLNDPTGLGETGEIYLVNQNKLMITQARLINEPTRLSEKVESYPVQQALAGKSGVASYTDFHGDTDLGYYAPIPDRGWVIVAEIDEEEALAPVRQQGQTALILIVVAVLAALGMAAVLSGYLGRQVGEIQKVFRAAAVGNFDARAQILSQDELGRTADGVNTMLERLTEFMGVAASAARQRFSDVVTTLSDWVWETDAQGNYTYCSDRILEVAGYAPEEMIGRSAAEFVAPEDRERAAVTIQEAVVNKQPISNLEVHGIRKDGSISALQISAIPVLDSRGEVRGLRGTGSDITERKQAEEAVRSSERLLRSIIDATKDWIFLKDNNYRYMVVNEAFAYEYGRITPDEMVGKDDYDLGTPTYLIEGDPERGIRGFRADDRAVIEDKQTLTNPYDVVNFRDGTEHVFHTVKAPLYNAQGEIVGVLGVARDITERRQAEDQIKQQNETLSRTLDELRNLMSGVENAAGQVTGASGSLQDVMELIASQASSSAEIAEQAAGSAQEGGRAVSDTVSAMGRIRETSQETARRIKRLGEVSQEIGEVVRLIDEIADRVTVLALNASIQAAAAGDAGRGFAVVAEEVQRLAERATGATRQIENLIKGVQGDINEAMVSVEEVTQEVVGGSQLAQNAGDRMTELNRVVNDLSSLIQNVAQTTTRQTTESLATLTSLAEGLQSSVAALRMPESEYAGGNGHSDSMTTTDF